MWTPSKILIMSLAMMALSIPKQIEAEKELSEGSHQVRIHPYSRASPGAGAGLWKNPFAGSWSAYRQQVSRRSPPLSFDEGDEKVVIRKSGSQDRSKSLMMRLFKRNYNRDAVEHHNPYFIDQEEDY